MDNNINVLDELNKGCSMGMVALDYIIKKSEENEFNKLLTYQYKEYEDLSSRINELYDEYTSDKIHETSFIEKAMTWYGIQKDTIMNNSISKIAELLINGTNMGIIEGRKLINNKKMDKDIHKLCSEYIKMQEKYLEKLKEFL